jgi:hypothetical protein
VIDTDTPRLPALTSDALMAGTIDISKLYVDPRSHFDKTLIGPQSYSTCAPRFLLHSWLMSATLCLALRSSRQLGTLRRSLCSDLYVSHLNSSFSIYRGPLADVYVYNFPDDRRALKLLGEYSTFVSGSIVIRDHD